VYTRSDSLIWVTLETILHPTSSGHMCVYVNVKIIRRHQYTRVHETPTHRGVRMRVCWGAAAFLHYTHTRTSYPAAPRQKSSGSSAPDTTMLLLTIPRLVRSRHSTQTTHHLRLLLYLTIYSIYNLRLLLHCCAALPLIIKLVIVISGSVFGHSY